MAASGGWVSQAGGDRRLSGVGDDRGGGWVLVRRLRSFTAWNRGGGWSSELDLVMKLATVEGVVVNLATVTDSTADLVAVNLATVTDATTDLVAVKTKAGKGELSDLVELMVFSDPPGSMVFSELLVGLCGAWVQGFGGWSTATEPP